MIHLKNRNLPDAVADIKFTDFNPNYLFSNSNLLPQVAAKFKIFMPVTSNFPFEDFQEDSNTSIVHEEENFFIFESDPYVVGSPSKNFKQYLVDQFITYFSKLAFKYLVPFYIEIQFSREYPKKLITEFSTSDIKLHECFENGLIKPKHIKKIYLFFLFNERLNLEATTYLYKGNPVNKFISKIDWEEQLIFVDTIKFNNLMGEENGSTES